MAPQNPYFQQQSFGLPAQAQASKTGQLPAPSMPYSHLPTATYVTNSVQHNPSIPDYGVPVRGGPLQATLPQSNALGRELDSASGRATVDLNGFSMPLTASTVCQISPSYVSRNISSTYASPYGSVDGTATPGLHSPFTPSVPQASSHDVSSPAPSLVQTSRALLLGLPPPLPQQSPLPPSTVGRKVPRKSTFVPAQSIQNSPKVVKGKTKSEVPGLRKSTIAQDSTRRSFSSGVKTLKYGVWRNTHSTSAMTFPAGSKKAIASRRSHRAIANERVAPDEDDRISPPVPSIEVDDELENEPVPPPIKTRGRLRAMRQNARPQPRYEYEVPPELEGVKRALGLDDWTEYVMLAEKYVLEEIAEKEFNAASQRIFNAVDAKLHERVQGMVVNLMIIPVVEHTVQGEVKQQMSS